MDAAGLELSPESRSDTLPLGWVRPFESTPPSPLQLIRLTALLALSQSAPLPDAAGAVAGPLHAILLVDMIPDRAVPGNGAKSLALLHQVAAETSNEPGSRSFLVLQDIGRPNHITLDEVRVSQAVYEAHEGGSASKAFRTGIQPLLAAPIDDRLGPELR